MVLLTFIAFPVRVLARGHGRSLAGALLLSACLSPAAAWAQASEGAGPIEPETASVPSSGVRETAEEDGPAPEHAAEYDRLVLSALAAFKAGEWARARGLFERAHGLHPTARTLRTIGMAAFNQGDLVGAVQALEASLSDDRKPLTVEQQEHVRQLIRRADGRLGRLRLLVRPEGADIVVDGKAPDFVGGTQLVLEPGRHEISVAADGYRTRVQHVRVSARDRATLEVHLEPGEDDVASPPAAEGRQAEVDAFASTEGDPSGTPNLAPWIAIGVGAAALVTAGVVGTVAYGQRKDLEDECGGRECPPASHADVDDYTSLRTVTLVTLGLGVLGVGLGATLLALDGGGEAQSPSTVQAQVGPGWVQVRGRL